MTLSFAVQEATGPNGAIGDLVLIHGWGMHCGVFGQCLDHWRQNFRLLTLDLPGHGKNHQHSMTSTMSQLCDEVILALDQISPAASAPIWLGWSLGGQVAMTIALTHPQRVSRLILASSTARFVAGSDWPHGMADDVFASFAEELKSDHQATWKRFLMLEAHGAKTARQDLRELQSLAAQYPAPSQKTLSCGLQLLRETDLRNQASELTQPCLVISGQRDRLVPPSAAQWLADHLPQGQLELMDRCGHAPFIGDPHRFTQRVKSFAQPDRTSQPQVGHV